MLNGHNLLFQMFYGMPSRIVNTNGRAIQGTLGFVGALIKMANPSHLVVLFDGEHENERASILPDYKANRIDYSQVAEENNPFSQLQDVYNALSFMGIKYTEVEELETDDVIASYVYTYEQAIEIVITSFDSDFFQLINENVKVLRYRGKNTVICDNDFLKSKYNVIPSYYADFKSLIGDHSDNITGAENVGIKTASVLINQFGSLQNIINNVENISKKSIRESIVRNKGKLQDNYKLIKLENRTKLPFSLNEPGNELDK